MSASELPAPLVTITDPRHPGSLGANAAPVLRLRPALRPRERLLVTALVLLLVAAVTSSDRLRADQRREQRLAGLELAAFVTGGELDHRDSVRLRVHLLLRADDATDVDVTSFRVGEGWQLQGGTAGLRLVHGTAAVLIVSHLLECGRPPAAPRQVSFTAAVDGAGSRDLAVEVVDGLRGVAFDAAPYCGELDCRVARRSLDGAAHEQLPHLLEVQVDGRGGPGGAVVDVPGLLAFLEVDWARRCAGGARR